MIFMAGNVVGIMIPAAKEKKKHRDGYYRDRYQNMDPVKKAQYLADVRAWRKAHPLNEEQQKAGKIYRAQRHIETYALRKDAINAKKRERYHADSALRARIRAGSTKWWNENYPTRKEQYLAGQRNWYRANRVKKMGAVTLWAKEHPQITRARRVTRQAAYRAKQYGVDGRFHTIDIATLYQNQDGKCRYCSSELRNIYEVDHMTPLSRGGSNKADNLCCACSSCNRSKHTRTADEFLATMTEALR